MIGSISLLREVKFPEPEQAEYILKIYSPAATYHQSNIILIILINQSVNQNLLILDERLYSVKVVV